MGGVASFDVFDTVVTRLIGGPAEVFVETGRRARAAGLIAVDPATYAAARNAAHQDLTTDKALHPELATIMAEAASRLALPLGTSAALVELELAVERDACRAVPGAADRLATRRADTGRGVVFISDTPLPSQALRAILEREGLFLPGDQLVVSAGAGASKEDGGLFAVVSAHLGVRAEESEHVGDDPWADLVGARRHGWEAALDSRARLTTGEVRLDAAGLTTNGIGPRLAGASRMVRLHALHEGGDADLASVAGGVATPLLVGFGLWVLAQARLLELDRLYFLSRDGEVFQEVTQRLADHAGRAVECRYLYGSRKAWQAGDHEDGSGQDSAIGVLDGQQPESMTAREVLSLVGVEPSDAFALTGSPLLHAQLDTVLGVARWAELRRMLTRDPIATAVRRGAEEQRGLLLRYLDQEDVTGPGRVAFVDVGWTGRTARSLENVLRDAGRPLPTAHLFLGLLATSPERMGPDLHARSSAWLIDEARGRPTRTAREDPVMVVESFAMGTEGHTTGYVLAGDEVRPRLSSPANPRASQWPLTEYRRALHLGLDALVEGPPLDDGVDLRPLVWDGLLGFWRSPTKPEALAWGAQPYSEDYANSRSYPLAAPFTGRRVLAKLGLGRPEWRTPMFWLGGTTTVSPQPWRSLLLVAQQGRTLVRRLPRVPRALRGRWLARRR